MRITRLLFLYAMIVGLGLIPAGRLTAQTLTLTPLHSFSAGDGADPYGGLVLSGNTLYGVTEADEFPGAGFGTVFKINTDGTGFTNLHVFNSSDGANPYARLVLADDTLYGTSTGGGSSGSGTVFKINTDVWYGFQNPDYLSGSDTLSQPGGS